MIQQAAEVAHSELRQISLSAFRDLLRGNRYTGHTAGICAGLLQTNLVILPKEYSADFEAFCQKNPKPCPLIAQSASGEIKFSDADDELDLRYDVPLYHVHENGKHTGITSDIRDFWREDFVAFAIGCSFSFERALIEAGITLRHIEQDKTVPMFRTSLQTTRVGQFYGPVVVSMRPIAKEQVERVVSISGAFPHAHGAPLHVGDPAEIGIKDFAQPDWGDAVDILENEVPVFWGCGVTTQLALANAKPNLAITHAPGAMLILNAHDDARENNKTN